MVSEYGPRDRRLDRRTRDQVDLITAASVPKQQHLSLDFVGDRTIRCVSQEFRTSGVRLCSQLQGSAVDL